MQSELPSVTALVNLLCKKVYGIFFIKMLQWQKKYEIKMGTIKEKTFIVAFVFFL